jgi:hypothetical protein
LIRWEYRDSFDQCTYVCTTPDVILELKGHGVSVAAVLGDNSAAQHAGLRWIVEEFGVLTVNGIVIVPWANHTLNLVFRGEMSENGTLQKGSAVTRKFQRIMRTTGAASQYGRMCPDLPDTRWFYISAVLRWIVDETNER